MRHDVDHNGARFTYFHTTSVILKKVRIQSREGRRL
ncbi:hypothetical protein C8J25_101492 [Sphingomonas faeni]|uniref:Uncharacterized protein n=1 Tax=Sphingomonas faeni TaxID=185950 RepID=A0A2T5UBX3_9SPHN|nr:hypothetical protein C8J25_101492 [Sphingomonas faeni]